MGGSVLVPIREKESGCSADKRHERTGDHSQDRDAHGKEQLPAEGGGIVVAEGSERCAEERDQSGNPVYRTYRERVVPADAAHREYECGDKQTGDDAETERLGEREGISWTADRYRPGDRSEAEVFQQSSFRVEKAPSDGKNTGGSGGDQGSLQNGSGDRRGCIEGGTDVQPDQSKPVADGAGHEPGNPGRCRLFALFEDPRLSPV